MKGKIEVFIGDRFWTDSAYDDDLEDLFAGMLPWPVSMPYRWREGSRAVVVWPEERMGEVMEIPE